MTDRDYRYARCVTCPPDVLPHTVDVCDLVEEIEWDATGGPTGDEGCPGHESLDSAHMGESVFCDGSCVR